jgi:hypothetical protein
LLAFRATADGASCRLVKPIDQHHELVKLTSLIDCSTFAEAWSSKLESSTGGQRWTRG